MTFVSYFKKVRVKMECYMSYVEMKLLLVYLFSFTEQMLGTMLAFLSFYLNEKIGIG